MSKILILGDYILDRYTYGTVERISPEAPVPVLLVESTEEQLGGAGNVARNVVSLGEDVLCITITGNDENGAILRNKISQISSYLNYINNNKTTVKQRYICQNHHLLRTDIEDTTDFSQADRQWVLDTVRKNLKDVAVVVVSDYAKGLVSRHFIMELVRLTNKPIIVDPKSHYEFYCGASILKPNVKWLHENTGLPVNTDEQVQEAMHDLACRSQVKTILVTRGDKGSVLLADGTITFFQLKKKPIIDVTGAGDTVLATLAVMLSRNKPIVECARLANIAGYEVVSKAGASTITEKELYGLA